MFKAMKRIRSHVEAAWPNAGFGREYLARMISTVWTFLLWNLNTRTYFMFEMFCLFNFVGLVLTQESGPQNCHPSTCRLGMKKPGNENRDFWRAHESLWFPGICFRLI